MPGILYHEYGESYFQIVILLRIDYGDDGAINTLGHSNLNSSALDCLN